MPQGEPRVSDRAIAAPPVLLSGDPWLAAKLRAALAGLEIQADFSAGSAGLEVFLGRARFDPRALEREEDAARLGRSFLPCSFEWGTAALGPLRWGGRRDPCIECCLAPLCELRRDDGLLDEAPPAEPAPLPGLVCAMVASEIRNLLTRGTSSWVGGQLHVTPRSGDRRASPPELLWVPGTPRPGCARCGEAQGPTSRLASWDWLPDPEGGPRSEEEAGPSPRADNSGRILEFESGRVGHDLGGAE